MYRREINVAKEVLVRMGEAEGEPVRSSEIYIHYKLCEAIHFHCRTGQIDSSEEPGGLDENTLYFQSRSSLTTPVHPADMEVEAQTGRDGFLKS